jgi:TRAP-type C4-dicarboxylate transport system permease small subunit
MGPTEIDTDRAPDNRFLAAVVGAEELLLSLFLSTMILLACYQIGLRWFTSGGLPWIDPLLRYLVLWSGLLGAVLATARDNHIALDAVGYLLHDRLKQGVRLIVHLFCVVVSVFLFRATLIFIKSEFEYGGPDLFGLSTGMWYLIFPIAFGLILAHFSIGTVAEIKQLIQGRLPEER